MHKIQYIIILACSLQCLDATYGPNLAENCMITDNIVYCLHMPTKVFKTNATEVYIEMRDCYQLTEAKLYLEKVKQGIY